MTRLLGIIINFCEKSASCCVISIYILIFSNITPTLNEDLLCHLQHIEVSRRMRCLMECIILSLFCNTGPTGDKGGSAPLPVSLHQVQQAEGEKSRRGSIQHSWPQRLHQGQLHCPSTLNFNFHFVWVQHKETIHYIFLLHYIYLITKLLPPPPHPRPLPVVNVKE